MATKANAKAQRGYARNARDEAILIGSGLKTSAVYLEGRGSETLGRIRMRPGELLATVQGLRALGDSRRDIVAAVKHIHSQGAAVLDIDTDERSDRNGVEMLDRALARLKNERIMPPGKAEAMQVKSVKARTNGRLPDRQALTIWHNPRLTIGEAIEQMPGWSARAAYMRLGKRGLPVGPRGRKD
jgi:hypothetical protein